MSHPTLKEYWEDAKHKFAQEVKMEEPIQQEQPLDIFDDKNLFSKDLMEELEKLGGKEMQEALNLF